MRIAYADPPYMGYSRYYRADPNCAEVDHAALIASLDREYDGWALSLYSNALRLVLPMCPDGVRVGAWVKPWSAGRKGISPKYAWEPVIFKPARKKAPKGVFVHDWTMCATTTRTGLVGAKPEHFCYWLFQILHARANDTLVDLYPGTRVVSRAWEAWRRQVPMEIPA